MSRLSFVLFIAVMGSAFVLVRTQYESRQLTTELDRTMRETHRIETELDRLEVERRAQATPLRVERMAREQLRMRTITPAITQYAGAAQAAPSAPAPAPATASTTAPAAVATPAPSANGGQQP